LIQNTNNSTINGSKGNSELTFLKARNVNENKIGNDPKTILRTFPEQRTKDFHEEATAAI